MPASLLDRAPGQDTSSHPSPCRPVKCAAALAAALPCVQMLSESAKTVLTKGENKMEIFESLPLKSETNFMDQGKAFRAFSEFPRLAAKKYSVKNSKKVTIIFYNSKC